MELADNNGRTCCPCRGRKVQYLYGFHRGYVIYSVGPLSQVVASVACAGDISAYLDLFLVSCPCNPR